MIIIDRLRKKNMPVITIKTEKQYLIIPENILDVRTGQLLTNQALLVSGKKIKAVLPQGGIGSFTEMGDAGIIALPGITLLPGLIDCHVHFALDGVDFNQALGRWTDPVALDQQLQQAAAGFLNAGVTAVRDGGDGASIGFATRNRISQGEITGPLVIATGWAIRREGLYGSFLGPGIRDVREGRKQIAELARLGVDQIKIIVSGIVSFKEFGKVGPVQFDLPELTALVQAAHDHGLKVMAHTSSDLAVRTAALTGVDSLEHGYFISEESLKIIAYKNIAWVPTLVPLVGLTAGEWRHLRTNQEINVLEKTVALHLEKVFLAAKMGILLGIGTDAGAISVTHGGSYLDEMQLFHQAGLSNLACLQAATVQAARIIGCDFLGTIAPGMICNMIGVMGNPLENLDLLRNPAYILKAE